jgi:hypothetical protein
MTPKLPRFEVILIFAGGAGVPREVAAQIIG